jgi:ketosteroid isomerase-like protein
VTSVSNLDLVRSLRSSWDRGDFSPTDWADPEIEYVIVDGPAPRCWTGLHDMAKGWRDFLGDWEGWRAQATEFQELDSERVLVLVELSGRNRASGLEVGQIGSAQGANLFHVRDGKVAKFVLYLDRERALADLGLSPEGDSPSS